ncbi:MAG: leucine-rich repeat domain-containing protein [Bacteroidales bacterium]|nr:leucine-rich repeat domain-containing protein [Bacteroidales bacterium]
MTSIVIPDSVTEIECGTFAGCSRLTSIVIPDSVINICGAKDYLGIHGAFFDCNELKSVTIGNSVRAIYRWAFFRCTNLTKINIPYSVEYVGDCAFYGCTKLQEETEEKILRLNEYAFSEYASEEYEYIY